MKRSLGLVYNNQNITDDTLEIQLPSIGTDISPIYITVLVDGGNNGSFTVIPNNDYWFKYEVKRDCNKVQIVLIVDKNLSTDNRIGFLEIEHNCVNMTKTIALYQNGSEYSLSANYKTKSNGWVFSSVPSNVYEEKTITIQANNGSGKWYLKEIQQYQTLQNDTFDDIKNATPKPNEVVSQKIVPYDGSFKYRIQGDEFIIQSFGNLNTQNNGHMRYYFVFSHLDVNNGNKGILNSKGVEYEKKMMIVFNDVGDVGRY